VFENRVLRRLFGCKREDVVGGWRRLHSEGLQNLYGSPNIIIRVIKSRRMRWAGNIARMGERNAYKMLIGEPGVRRPLGRPRRRWVGNIRMDLRETGWEDVDWIHLLQVGELWGAILTTVMKFRIL
jgi:hypothetical protein